MESKTKYEFTQTLEQVAETIQAYFIYEVLNEEIQMLYSWSYSLLALSIIACLGLIRRRKKNIT